MTDDIATLPAAAQPVRNLAATLARMAAQEESKVWVYDKRGKLAGAMNAGMLWTIQSISINGNQAECNVWSPKGNGYLVIDLREHPLLPNAVFP